MDANLGEKIPVENRKRLPLCFNLNSKTNENGKGSDNRRSCWMGSGLIVEVVEKGKRQVSWDSTKPSFGRREWKEMKKIIF